MSLALDLLFIIQAGGETFQLRVGEPSTSSTSIDHITYWKGSICKIKDGDYSGTCYMSNHNDALVLHL